MPDLAHNPIFPLTDTQTPPQYPDCPPWKKMLKRGGGKKTRLPDPLPGPIYPPPIINSHRQGPIRLPGTHIDLQEWQSGYRYPYYPPREGNLGTREVYMGTREGYMVPLLSLLFRIYQWCRLITTHGTLTILSSIPRKKLSVPFGQSQLRYKM